MTTNNDSNIYPELLSYIREIGQEFDLIPEDRKILLKTFKEYIESKKTSHAPILLNFICTHNSRRSHISQIWAATASIYYGVDQVETYSGGTEATAFNPRAVAAMQRAGFQIHNPGGENPVYLVSFAENQPPLECFSKTFDDVYNPQKGFAAIMTCSQADENCPFVPGAAFRLALTYEDPKVADDTPSETSHYDERVRQIGRELFYAFSQIEK